MNFFLSPRLPDELKAASPPTLEPTGPTPPPRRGDTPLEPPTLRPITGEPQPLNWPRKRLKLDDDVTDDADAATATGNKNCTKAREQPASPPPILHSSSSSSSTSDGQATANGLPELGVTPRPATGGVGRRTSVLFKKAKNGAKLFRERDGGAPLLNGKGPQDGTSNSNSSASTPSSTPLSTPTKRPLSPGPPALGDRCTKDQSAKQEPSEAAANHKPEPGEDCIFTQLIECFYMINIM